MQAPIPPIPDQVAHIQKTRPRGLNTVTALLCVSNLTSYLWAEWEPIQLTLFTVLITLYYVILWYFWNGYNWARIVVLVFSVLILGNVFYFAENTLLQNVISTADMILSVYLLYWLNTRPIREYFKQ